MNRSVSIAAVLVFALVLTGCKDDHDAIAKKGVAKMQELADTMKTVKDEASSKAAATKVKSITADLQELKKKEEALPKITAEQKKKLEDTYTKPMETAIGEMMKESMRIAMNPTLMTPELKAAMEDLGKFGR
jgi:hypothetical protein